MKMADETKSSGPLSITFGVRIIVVWISFVETLDSHFQPQLPFYTRQNLYTH